MRGNGLRRLRNDTGEGPGAVVQEFGEGVTGLAGRHELVEGALAERSAQRRKSS
jgi:hypothetical protein